mmetsp:Transcript_2102/g.4558  ORF Transcript_2102/g.4558 Transcript_2102/m.4558 type:complete len:313 (-) Transcript_2102:513-1451(-)
MIEGMVDLDTLSRLLRPHPAAPDAAVGTVDVLRALSACPAIQSCPAVHADATPELQAFEAWVLSVNALTQRQLSALSTSEHRALLLLCFRLMQRCCPVVLDAASEAAQCTVNEIATRVLMQAQMLMPRNSWVQQQLAIARTAVLLQSRLWSHTDDECRRLAALALEEGGLPSPRLQLQAAVRPHAAEGAIRSGARPYDHPRSKVLGSGGGIARPWLLKWDGPSLCPRRLDCVRAARSPCAPQAASCSSRSDWYASTRCRSATWGSGLRTRPSPPRRIGITSRGSSQKARPTRCSPRSRSSSPTSRSTCSARR